MRLAPPNSASSLPQRGILQKQLGSGSELTQRCEETGSIDQLSKGSLSLQALATRKLFREHASRQVVEALRNPELEQARLTVDLIPSLTQDEIVGLSLLNDCLPHAALDLPASPLARYASAPPSPTTASEIRELLPSCNRALTFLVSLCLKFQAFKAAHRASPSDSAPECDRAQKSIASVCKKIHEWLEGYELAGSALATDEPLAFPELRPEDESMVQTFVRSQHLVDGLRASWTKADSAAAWYRDHRTFLLDKDRNPIVSPNNKHGIWCDRNAQDVFESKIKRLRERLILAQDLRKCIVVLLHAVEKHRGPEVLHSGLEACLWSLDDSLQLIDLKCQNVTQTHRDLSNMIVCSGINNINGPTYQHVVRAFHAVYVGEAL